MRSLLLISIIFSAFIFASEANLSKKITYSKDRSTMLLIPAGVYEIGNPETTDEVSDNRDERPAHDVKIDAFYIDRFEVTNRQYQLFLSATDYEEPEYWNEAEFNLPSQPVVGVTWDDAFLYAQWAGKRLPTEAEWEIVARGNFSNRVYPWGKEFHQAIDGITIHANVKGFNDGFATTAPVGSFPTGVSPFDIHDLAGNVMEWVADWYDENYYAKSPTENPRNDRVNIGKVTRGGSWQHLPEKTRCTRRAPLPRNTVNKAIGFRCAISVAGIKITTWGKEKKE